MTKEHEKLNVENALLDDITQEKLRAAKEKHGEQNVKVVQIFDQDADDLLDTRDKKVVLSVIVKVPTRQIVAKYRDLLQKSSYEADEMLVKNCLLTHKEEVLNNDGIFYGVLNGIAKLIPIQTSKLVNF